MTLTLAGAWDSLRPSLLVQVITCVYSETFPSLLSSCFPSASFHRVVSVASKRRHTPAWGVVLTGPPWFADLQAPASFRLGARTLVAVVQGQAARMWRRVVQGGDLTLKLTSFAPARHVPQRQTVTQGCRSWRQLSRSHKSVSVVLRFAPRVDVSTTGAASRSFRSLLVLE